MCSNPCEFEVTCCRPESNRGPYGLLNFLSAALSITELWWRMNHRKSFRTLLTNRITFLERVWNKKRIGIGSLYEPDYGHIHTHWHMHTFRTRDTQPTGLYVTALDLRTRSLTRKGVNLCLPSTGSSPGHRVPLHSGYATINGQKQLIVECIYMFWRVWNVFVCCLKLYNIYLSHRTYTHAYVL